MFCSYPCIIGIIQEYLQKVSISVKLQVSNLNNEFLDRYFSRIFMRIKRNEIKLNYTIEAWNSFLVDIFARWLYSNSWTFLVCNKFYDHKVLWFSCVQWSIIIEMGKASSVLVFSTSKLVQTFVLFCISSFILVILINNTMSL